MAAFEEVRKNQNLDHKQKSIVENALTAHMYSFDESTIKIWLQEKVQDQDIFGQLVENDKERMRKAATKRYE